MPDQERPIINRLISTQSDRDIAEQIMDTGSICAMGNGACPTECPIFEGGQALLSDMPFGTDLAQARAELRTGVLFGDVFRPDDTANIEFVKSSCVLEKPPGPAS